jgi:predicted MFS family arabinose efflux permease
VSEKATANSLFNAAIPISGIIGGLIAGAIFAFYGNYPGWRYLFWYEGALALIGALMAYFLLTDFPHQAKWLSEEEKEELARAKAEEETQQLKIKWTKALANRNVILLAIVYFLGITSLYGYSIWLPSIIKVIASVSASLASFLSVIPYAIASISLPFISRYADRKQNHKFVTVLVLIIAGIGLALSALTKEIFVLSFIFFIIAALGIYNFLPPFWAVPQKSLHGDAAAASIGLINAVGNLGGIAGPMIVGALESLTGSFMPGIYAMALFAFLAGIVMLLVKFK